MQLLLSRAMLYSLSFWRRLHLNPPRARQRSIWLRVCQRTMVAGPNARDHSLERNQHAEQSE